MQISKSKLRPKLEKEIKHTLSQVVADLKSQDNAKIFLRDFLTPAEELVLAKRLAILEFLEKGKSYDEIRNTLKVSSATIASVQAMLEQQSEGFMLALKRIKADQWAEEWSQKITHFFQNLSGSKT